MSRERPEATPNTLESIIERQKDPGIEYYEISPNLLGGLSLAFGKDGLNNPAGISMPVINRGISETFFSPNGPKGKKELFIAPGPIRIVDMADNHYQWCTFGANALIFPNEKPDSVWKAAILPKQRLPLLNPADPNQRPIIDWFKIEMAKRQIGWTMNKQMEEEIRYLTIIAGNPRETYLGILEELRRSALDRNNQALQTFIRQELRRLG